MLNTSVCQSCTNTMLAASAFFSDELSRIDVPLDTILNIVPADQVSIEADEYKYKCELYENILDKYNFITGIRPTFKSIIWK